MPGKVYVKMQATLFFFNYLCILEYSIISMLIETILLLTFFVQRGYDVVLPCTFSYYRLSRSDVSLWCLLSPPNTAFAAMNLFCFSSTFFFLLSLSSRGHGKSANVMPFIVCVCLGLVKLSMFCSQHSKRMHFE